jgi:hypothetical protein
MTVCVVIIDYSVPVIIKYNDRSIDLVLHNHKLMGLSMCKNKLSNVYHLIWSAGVENIVN